MTARIEKITRVFTRSGSVYEVRENSKGEFFFRAIKVNQPRFEVLEGRAIPIYPPRLWPPTVGDRLDVCSIGCLMPTSNGQTLSTSPIEAIEEVAR